MPARRRRRAATAATPSAGTSRPTSASTARTPAASRPVRPARSSAPSSAASSSSPTSATAAATASSPARSASSTGGPTTAARSSARSATTGRRPGCSRRARRPARPQSIQFGEIEDLRARAARRVELLRERGIDDARGLRPAGHERRRHARDLHLPRRTGGVQSAVGARGADRPPAGGLAVGGGRGRPDARRRRGRVLHSSIDVRLMLKLILLVPAAALLVFAGEGIYHAARGRQAVTLTCDQLAAERPSSPRVAVAGCEINYAGAGYRESRGQIDELFLPARPGGGRAVPAPIVIATRDPGAIALARSVVGGGPCADERTVARGHAESRRRAADLDRRSTGSPGPASSSGCDRSGSFPAWRRRLQPTRSSSISTARPGFVRPGVALGAGRAARGSGLLAAQS